jgi:TolA-binding protein
VNRYSVVKKASYRYGEIEAEIGEDNSFMDKTRRTILARIFDAGEYWDVECRVLLQIEDSDVESLNEHQPRYNWRTIAEDQILSTKLNNEIKAALSGGAWDAKQPLVPDSHAGPGHQRIRVLTPADPPTSGEGADEGASDKAPKHLRDATQREPRTASLPPLGEEEYERLGIKLLERGSYDKATQAFKAARESRPSSLYASYLLAQSLFASGDYSQAAQAIREGAGQNPDWPRVRVDVRSFYSDARDLKTQLSKLEAFVGAHPDDADAQLVLGYMAYFTRDYQRAEQVFTRLEAAPARQQDSTKQDNGDAGLASSYRRLAQVELDRSRGLEEF